MANGLRCCQSVQWTSHSAPMCHLRGMRAPQRLKMACLPLLPPCVACVASSFTFMAVRALMGNTCKQQVGGGGIRSST